MPLTTRPRSTSRQGMTRLASMVQDRGSGKITASRGKFPRSSVLRLSLALPQFVRLGLGLLEVECALIDRATGNDTVDAFGFDFAQGLDVLDAREAAARDHRNAQSPRELQRRLDVHSGQHAVAADVGVDDRFDAIVLEFLREVHHVVTGHLGPALDGDFAVLGVERDDDVPGKSRARVLQEAWIFYRRRPDDDVADPEIEIVLDRVQVPDAPAQL